MKVVEVESKDPPEAEDRIRHEAALPKEAQDSYERLYISESKHRIIGGRLRDSSVELVDPLSPEVDKDVLGEDVSEEST